MPELTLREEFEIAKNKQYSFGQLVLAVVVTALMVGYIAYGIGQANPRTNPICDKNSAGYSKKACDDYNKFFEEQQENLDGTERIPSNY